MTVTPTWDAANVILNPGCRYVPVPYVLPGPEDNQSTVFNIELISCVQSTEYDATFISAAQKWMSIITGDIDDYAYYGTLDCGLLPNGTKVATCQMIDDVVITFSVEYIDGPYYTLGSAGPAYTRTSGWPQPFLPLSGRMKFDSADWALMIGDGTLESVVQHEMGHVLGIGSLWTKFGYLNPSNCSSYQSPFTPPTPKFLGSNANASLSLIDPTNFANLSYVPVEDTGGGGTRCAHWKESRLKQELMTGWISQNGNPLSYLTAMSLQDMGYTVNLTSPHIATNFDLKTALSDSLDKGSKDYPIGDCLDGFDVEKLVMVDLPMERRRR